MYNNVYLYYTHTHYCKRRVLYTAYIIHIQIHNTKLCYIAFCLIKKKITFVSDTDCNTGQG